MNVNTGEGVQGYTIFAYYTLNLGYTGWGCVGESYLESDEEGYFEVPDQTLDAAMVPDPPGLILIGYKLDWKYAGLNLREQTRDKNLHVEVFVAPDDRDVYERSVDLINIANVADACVSYSDPAKVLAYYEFLRKLYFDAVRLAGGSESSSEDELIEFGASNIAVGGVGYSARELLRRLNIPWRNRSLPVLTLDDIRGKGQEVHRK